MKNIRCSPVFLESSDAGRNGEFRILNCPRGALATFGRDDALLKRKELGIFAQSFLCDLRERLRMRAGAFQPHDQSRNCSCVMK